MDTLQSLSLSHISEKPWSDYTEADYTLQQWHAACLIHLHTGPPTSKDQCKLPVRTPNGAVNRNGVHAALAALHGARTPLKASAEQKAKAASALRGLYGQLGEPVPDSLKQSALTVDDILIHYGVKGMRWGHRKAQVTAAVSSHVPHLTEQQKSTAKKVAIGVGVATLAVGSAYVAYRLNKSGKISLNPLRNRHPMEVQRILEKNPKVRLSRRETKRYNKFLAGERARAVRMRSAQILAERNLARSKLPDQYVRDASGNYVPRIGVRENVAKAVEMRKQYRITNPTPLLDAARAAASGRPVSGRAPTRAEARKIMEAKPYMHY